MRADRGQICIRVCYGAKPAVLRRVSVRNIPARHTDVFLQIFSTGLPAGGVEDGIFDVGAGDGDVGETGGYHAADKVCEGGDAVHEDPEAWESGGRSKNT